MLSLCNINNMLSFFLGKINQSTMYTNKVQIIFKFVYHMRAGNLLGDRFGSGLAQFILGINLL